MVPTVYASTSVYDVPTDTNQVSQDHVIIREVMIIREAMGRIMKVCNHSGHNLLREYNARIAALDKKQHGWKVAGNLRIPAAGTYLLASRAVSP